MSTSRGRCMAGTLIAFASIAAPSVFTTIGELVDLNKSGQKRETDDITNHDSTSGYREYCPTIKDGGEWTASYNFVPQDTGRAALSALFESGDTVHWKVTLPDGLGFFSFSGFVSDYGNVKLPVTKKADDAFKVKVTGPVVENFGS